MKTYEEFVKGLTIYSASWEHVVKAAWHYYERAERAEAALLEIALRTSDAISNEVDEDSFLSACCECNVIATRAMEGTNEFPKDV